MRSGLAVAWLTGLLLCGYPAAVGAADAGSGLWDGEVSDSQAAEALGQRSDCEQALTPVNVLQLFLRALQRDDRETAWTLLTSDAQMYMVDQTRRGLGLGRESIPNVHAMFMGHDLPFVNAFWNAMSGNWNLSLMLDMPWQELLRRDGIVYVGVPGENALVFAICRDDLKPYFEVPLASEIDTSDIDYEADVDLLEEDSEDEEAEVGAEKTEPGDPYSKELGEWRIILPRG